MLHLLYWQYSKYFLYATLISVSHYKFWMNINISHKSTINRKKTKMEIALLQYNLHLPFIVHALLCYVSGISPCKWNGFEIAKSGDHLHKRMSPDRIGVLVWKLYLKNLFYNINFIIPLIIATSYWLIKVFLFIGNYKNKKIINLISVFKKV